MAPPCRGEGRLAEQDGERSSLEHGMTQLQCWRVRLRLSQTQPFAMCLPGPGQPLPSRTGSPSSSALNLLTRLSRAEEGPCPHPGLAGSWQGAG